MRNAIVITALLSLAACGDSDSASSTAGGLSANEARALDEAAEMIEERRLPQEALRPPVVPAPAPAQTAVPAPAPAQTAAQKPPRPAASASPRQ